MLPNVTTTVLSTAWRRTSAATLHSPFASQPGSGGGGECSGEGGGGAARMILWRSDCLRWLCGQWLVESLIERRRRRAASNAALRNLDERTLRRLDDAVNTCNGFGTARGGK